MPGAWSGQIRHARKQEETMTPELSETELQLISEEKTLGFDVPDVDSGVQVSCWKTEREVEAE